MRLLIVILWLAGAGGIAVAREVPLPRPRPPIWTEPQSFREIAGLDFDSANVTGEPTECDKRIQAIAVAEPLPRLIGPDACGGSDMLWEAIASIDRTSTEKLADQLRRA